MEETIEKTDALSLKEQLQQRYDQLEANRKQTEMSYVEIMGAIGEIKRVIALIP